MKRFLPLIVAVFSLMVCCTGVHAQTYTQQFIGQLNNNTIDPCGWPPNKTPTEQLTGGFSNLTYYGGGVVDLTCYTTAISITADVFSPVSVPVTLILPPHTITVNANATIPSNFTIVCYAGGSIVAGGGYTLTNNASDICGGSGGTPGGNNSDVQFNNAGNFGGNSQFTYTSVGGSGQWCVAIGSDPCYEYGDLEIWGTAVSPYSSRLELVQAVVSAGGGVEDDVLFSSYSRLNSAGQNMFDLGATGAMNNAGMLTAYTFGISDPYANTHSGAAVISITGHPGGLAADPDQVGINTNTVVSGVAVNEVGGYIQSDTGFCIAGTCVGNFNTPWSSLSASTANTTIPMTNHLSAFTWTDASYGMSWQNVTAATSSVAQDSPPLGLYGNFWNPRLGASEAAGWQVQTDIANGPDGQVVLLWQGGGDSEGGALFQINAPLAAAFFEQLSANYFAGTCTMASGITCTQTVTAQYTGTPICFPAEQGSAAIAASCADVSGTVTVTAASSNSDTWGFWLLGNPF